MHKITLLLTFFCFQMTTAQIPDWQWARNMDMYFYNWKKFTAVDSNGDIIVITDYATATATFGGITVTNNSEPDYTDIAIIKYDNQGNVLWVKSYGGTRQDLPVAVTTDASGNFYVAGSYSQGITFDGIALDGATGGTFIAKFDTNGNAVLAKKCSGDQGFAPITAMKTDTAGNIYLTGTFTVPTVIFGNTTLTFEGYNGTLNAYRAYVAKMDPQGNFLWAKAAQSNDEHYIGIMPYSLDVDANGNVYSGGHFGCNTMRFGNITLTKTSTYNFNFNMYLVKYDTNGNEMWARNTGSVYDNGTCAWAVKTDLANNVYAAGYFSNDVSFGNTVLSATGGAQLFIVKYDPSGNVLWAKNASAGSGFNAVHSMSIDENNNLYVAGIFGNSSINFGNGVTLTNPDVPDGAVFVVKYTAGGGAVWGRKAGPLNINNVLSVYCKNQNEIYIAGTFNTGAIHFGNSMLTKSGSYHDLYLAKLFYQPLSTAGWDRNKNTVYPNPATDKLYISRPEDFSGYTLYNVLGAKAAAGTLRPETGAIDISPLSKGVYLLQLSGSEATSETVKIIKE